MKMTPQGDDGAGDDCVDGFATTTVEERGYFEYRVSLTFCVDDEFEEELVGDNELFDMAMIESMVASTVTFAWDVTVPGEITETNADTHQESAAQFSLDGMDLINGAEMYVVSRENKPLLARCNPFA